MSNWINAFISLFFPRCCVVCDTPLVEGEEKICLRCQLDLPRTHYHLQKENPVEQLFWGKVPVERASSFFFYRKGSDYRTILHRLKYGGEKEIGAAMGRQMAAELLPGGFFEGIDVLVPVPLHARKLKQRGYNQSEWIGRGIADSTRLPLDAGSVIRIKATETQTRKSVYERWENVHGMFQLRHPERFRGKHVLLVDDVLTTGATVLACALAFQEVEGVKISILTLAVSPP